MILEPISFGIMIGMVSSVIFVAYLVATFFSLGTMPAIQKRTMRGFLGLAAGIIVIAASLWYFSCPVLTVTSTTQLWETEQDAATTWLRPGTSRLQLKPGDRIRVLWLAYGKDYRAYFVVGPHRCTGWVKDGRGVPYVLQQSNPIRVPS